MLDYVTSAEIFHIGYCKKKVMNSNKLVGHKIRHKARKETTSFIPNSRVTVQGEGRKDYHTEWSFSPELSFWLYMNLLYLHLQRKLPLSHLIEDGTPCSVKTPNNKRMVLLAERESDFFTTIKRENLSYTNK